MFLLLCGLPKYLYLVKNTVFLLVDFTCNYCTTLFNLINDKCLKNYYYYYYYYYYYHFCHFLTILALSSHVTKYENNFLTNIRHIETVIEPYNYYRNFSPSFTLQKTFKKEAVTANLFRSQSCWPFLMGGRTKYFLSPCFLSEKAKKS